MDSSEENDTTADFWVPSRSIKYLHKPTVIEFMREAVCAYSPVILTGLVDHWAAVDNWDLDYFEMRCGDLDVEINITPDGLGDCVKETGDGQRCFCYPAEHIMTMRSFCRVMKERHPADAVFYLSQQDNNFVKTFSNISADIETSLPIANEAFGCTDAEATNIWIGDERSTSSLHKDFFENMYVVVQGEKTFTLLPPTDIQYLREEEFPTRRYKVNRSSSSGGIAYTDVVLATEGCPSEVLQWIDIEIDTSTHFEDMPKHRRLHPICCTVRPGEILYIPAMWYHQVSQNSLTIAINYWYEMKFDFRYVFYQMARQKYLDLPPVEEVSGKIADDELET
jgi:jumonji domain-containing protein 7